MLRSAPRRSLRRGQGRGLPWRTRTNPLTDCPYLSNCIGRRNYRFFLAFVTSLPVYAALVVLMCMGQLIGVAQGDGFVAALQRAPVRCACVRGPWRQRAATSHG